MARKLSQEELADLLGVSRQSVSKWETGASVPELDKLVKLGEIFGVSLDELVKGEAFAEEQKPEAEKNTEKSAVPQTARTKRNGNRIAGDVYLFLGVAIFMLLTLYGGFVVGLVFCLPFVVCGVLCLTHRGKRIGLWCGWGLYLLIYAYLTYGTGMRWTTIFHTLKWTWQMNYFSLFVAWLEFLAAVLLVTLTARSWWGEPLILGRKGKTLYAFGFVSLFVVWFGGGALLTKIHAFALAAGGMRDGRMRFLFNFVSLIRDWGVWVLLAVLITVGFRLWQAHRAENKN